MKIKETDSVSEIIKGHEKRIESLELALKGILLAATIRLVASRRKHLLNKLKGFDE